VAKRLAERVVGLSPLAAREVAYRATGATDVLSSDVDWPHVADVVREFLHTRVWSPTVAYEDTVPIEYAPYELTHLGSVGARLQHFDSMSEAISVYYAAAPQPQRRGDPLAAERKALLAPLRRTTEATTRRIAALHHQLASATTERDSLRQAGELILAHQSTLESGSAQVTVNGQTIALDPHSSPVENAQAYFARYRKAREAEERVPVLLDEARHTLEYLNELATLVELADQMDAIRALRREVAAATGTSSRGPGKQAAQSTPYRRVALDGWEALVGTSAEGNAAVTFDLARPDDLWLHARGVPGAHVILRGSGEPPQEVVQRAAQLAAAHSAARGSTAVEVDVAARRYVKKIPGGPPGLVRYANERTLRVSPGAP
jgi:predicted ribosome quality control (RQC) complex YloA/Tae2 family protein